MQWILCPQYQWTQNKLNFVTNRRMAIPRTVWRPLIGGPSSRWPWKPQAPGPICGAELALTAKEFTAAAVAAAAGQLLDAHPFDG